ncbi:hypothetical protein [Deinococcus sp.]|uniref:hypothetical protein n=1 Tax=Deinococcus sp. TaxID=47478 RepID=UPI003B5BAB0D
MSETPDLSSHLQPQQTPPRRTLRIGINEEAADLATLLGLTLAQHDFTVLISHIRPETAPGQVTGALYSASTRLAVVDIHEDDLTDALTAAQQAQMDIHFVIFPCGDVLTAPINNTALGVRLSRGGRPETQIVDELRSAVEFALKLGRSLMWLRLEESDLP